MQLTIEDAGSVSGFISRYGDAESDHGEFLDHFFKPGKLDGKNLSFTTETVHGVSFEFKGTIERGPGKNPGDEAYYELKGTLTQNSTDANKKTSSKSREVVVQIFPAGSGLHRQTALKPAKYQCGGAQPSISSINACGDTGRPRNCSSSSAVSEVLRRTGEDVPKSSRTIGIAGSNGPSDSPDALPVRRR